MLPARGRSWRRCSPGRRGGRRIRAPRGDLGGGAEAQRGRPPTVKADSARSAHSSAASPRPRRRCGGSAGEAGAAGMQAGARSRRADAAPRRRSPGSAVPRRVRSSVAGGLGDGGGASVHREARRRLGGLGRRACYNRGLAQLSRRTIMSSLPPSADALAQSARLLETIEVSWPRWRRLDPPATWELALYAPGLGYYSGGAKVLARRRFHHCARKLTRFRPGARRQVEQVMRASAPPR